MLRACLALVAVTAFVSPAVSVFADDAREVPTYSGLHTTTLHFFGRGSVVAELGVEYLPSVTNDVAGIEGNLLRAPTLGLRMGLSNQAEFRIEWPVFNRMTITSRRDPPPLGRELGSSTTDFGDVVVATLIRLQSEHKGWPAWGIKFAAKLPNTNEKLGIGVNSTDVFASFLMSKSLGNRLQCYGDVGVGILTEPTQSFTQNDVLTYGFLGDYWTGGRFHLVGEVSGYHSTHEVGPGTTSSGEMRGGVIGQFGVFNVATLLTRGLARRDSQGIGVAVHGSVRIGLPGSSDSSGS